MAGGMSALKRVVLARQSVSVIGQLGRFDVRLERTLNGWDGTLGNFPRRSNPSIIGSGARCHSWRRQGIRFESLPMPVAAKHSLLNSPTISLSSRRHHPDHVAISNHRKAQILYFQSANVPSKRQHESSTP